jgi:hypothetical protein
MNARAGFSIVVALVCLGRPEPTAAVQAPASPSTTVTPLQAVAPSQTASPSPTVAPTQTASSAPSGTLLAPLPAETEHDLRGYLQVEGLDAELMARFVSGKPYAESERRAVVLTLAAMKKMSPSDADRFSVPAVGRAALADPFARGRMVSVRGRIKSIAKDKLTDDEIARVYPAVDSMDDDDPLRTFYRIEIEAEGIGTVTAFSLRAPAQLVDQPKLDQPGAVVGLYVKHSGAAPGESPLLVAAHVAWYPETPLGRLGMDMALFDDVRDFSEDLKNERECFYQLMATMRRADLGKLFDETDREYSAVPLFNEGASMRGSLIALQGKAHRATEVRVNDADIRRRFGIERFYEVEMFTRDSQGNPIIFNLMELPAGFPIGESISQDVRIPGVYLTGFAYNRDPTIQEREKNEKAKMQKAPLLIGKSLDMIDYDVAANPTDWVFGAIVIVVGVAICVAIWYWNRSSGLSRKMREQVDAPAPGTSLNDLPLEYRSKPDFSNVETRDKR